MDDVTKRDLARGLADNAWLEQGFEELQEVFRRQMEFGDPNNPDALVKANVALRTLRQAKDYLLAPANETVERDLSQAAPTDRSANRKDRTWNKKTKW